LFDRAQDRFEHAIRILQHVVVPESQNDIAHCFLDLSSLGITFLTFIVLPAIELNDELSISTNEVDNEPVDRHLPFEFPSIEPSAT